MATVAFCVKLREEAVAAFQHDTGLMIQRLMENPEFEFEGAKIYTADDGEFIVMVQYGSEKGLHAWRDDPEHRVIVERGKAEYLESAWLADVTPRIVFDRETGTRYPLAEQPVP